MRDDRTRQTYNYERWRAGAAGILETAGSTFLLLIAVRWLHAGPVSKALVAAAGSVGLLLTPAVVATVMERGWATSRAASGVLAVGAITFCVAAWNPTLPVFVPCAVAAMASSSAIIPLLTQMYQENYPD
jgi:hypothetical protein